MVKMIKVRARGPHSKLKVERQVKGGMCANQVPCQPNRTWDPWREFLQLGTGLDARIHRMFFEFRRMQAEIPAPSRGGNEG